MTAVPDTSNIAILGLGNVLLMDDGVGVHAVRALQNEPLEGVSCVEIGTAILNALEYLEDFGVVIALDAVQADGPPGTIYRFDLGPGDCEIDGRSLHHVGIAGAMHLLPDTRRPRVIVLGIEPERIDYGMELTPTVSRSLTRLIRSLKLLVQQLHGKESSIRNRTENPSARTVRASTSEKARSR